MKMKSEKSIIRKMVRKLVEQFDPDSIILFGSHARGTAQPDSDIDLLVILSFTGSKITKQLQMRLALHEFRVAKDVIVTTPEEVERYRNIPGTIQYPALREGKILYARQ